jgi:hypothetical protein
MGGFDIDDLPACHCRGRLMRDRLPYPEHCKPLTFDQWCRWLVDDKTGERYHVPGCWGGLHDPEGCYCNYNPEDVEEIEKLKMRIDELEKKVSALSNDPI